MGETGHGEISSARQVDVGSSVKARAGRFVGAGLAAVTLGIDIDHGTAHADDPPKTPTPAVSPTPDATRTAAESALKDLEERLKREQELKAIRDKTAATKAALDALTTPTATAPTPNAVATARAEATVNKLIAEEVAGIKATATAKAEATAKAKATPIPPTATPRPDQQGGTDPTPQPTSQPTSEAGTDGGSGGFDPGKIARDNWGLGAVALGGLALWKIREKRRDPPPPPGTGWGSNPNIRPNLGPNTTSNNPNTGPAQPKNPEWVIGQKEFERRWQAVKSKLSPVLPEDNGNEPGYILDRFKAGMNVVHEVSLDDAINAPEMNTRLRAGIEYLIPEIWPDNKIFRRFFDPGFNVGLLTPEDLARIIYLPEQSRVLSSFTRGQKRDVMRIRRILLHALHPDLLKSDADPKLQDYIDTLLKQLNSTWPLIDKLLS